MTVCHPVLSRSNLLQTLNSELKKEGIPPISRPTLYRWLRHPQGATTDIGVKTFYTVRDLEKLKVFARAMFQSNSYEFAQHVLIQWGIQNADEA